MNRTDLFRHLRAGMAVIACSTFALALSTGSWLGLLWFNGNVHAVTDGAVYRSAQLKADSLTATIEKYGIRSVLNLRGASVGDDWYMEEVSVLASHRVLRYDVGMYASDEPSADTVRSILHILRTAPRPLLIHCNGGSDRTGYVAAIYKHFVEGRSPEEAERQLSFRYGHFPWLGSKSAAMDNSFHKLIARERPAGLLETLVP
jgi:protein tyrosine/serine phosphatase